MARLLRSKRFANDLEKIWIWIANSSLRAADKFVLTLDQRLKLLESFPRAGRVRPEVAEDVRSLAFGEYIVFYRVEGTDVQLLRLLHGRRRISGEDVC